MAQEFIDKSCDVVDKSLKRICKAKDYNDFIYDFTKINEQLSLYFIEKASIKPMLNSYVCLMKAGRRKLMNLITDFILKDIDILPINEYQESLKYEYKIQLNDYIICNINCYYEEFINSRTINLNGIDFYVDYIIRTGKQENKNKLKTIAFELDMETLFKSEYLNELYKLFDEMGTNSINIYLQDKTEHEIYDEIFNVKNDNELFIITKAYCSMLVGPFHKKYQIKQKETFEIKSKYRDIITMEFIDHLMKLKKEDTFIINSKLIEDGLKITLYEYC